MNSKNSNVGGWPATKPRALANRDYINYLPSDLQSVITKTKVVSGHGNSDRNANRTDGNWESEDKIYLLSAHEVWEDGTSNQVSTDDTAYTNTRQLDYYKSKGLTTNNYSNAIKKINGSNSHWLLRGACSSTDYTFLSVNTDGNLSNSSATDPSGVAPAFRIG